MCVCMYMILFQNSEVDYGNQAESNKQFSMKVNELQGMINPSTQDLSSEILCLSIKTRKLEKKLNTRQVSRSADIINNFFMMNKSVPEYSMDEIAGVSLQLL